MALGKEGQAYYDEVLDEWPLHIGAQAILRQACVLLDQITELDRIVERDGLILQGARGQVIAHPALSASKQLKSAFSQLVTKLDLRYPGDAAKPQGKGKTKTYGDARAAS